ncbi:hypothetical protein GM418_30095 [Maribellus comscasis]|uniref:Uncharacterized protein n=1 Tax=Maribellus comscasis TaxID=2681766 RepID=A0A6I6JYV5_9BACT|nr:hypothetical protein [Maribellus comscasis]QGY47761.1 hypothetical protein GM418_30095 [Maribellus comscasis]
MNELVNKLSSYNLFNYLLPGVLFVVILNLTSSYDLLQDSLFEGALLYYFIGLVINRIGSLVIEPIFKKIKFVSYKTPEEFRNASTVYPRILIFSETNNMFRGLCAMFLILIIIVGLDRLGVQVDFNNGMIQLISLVVLLVLLLFSYRKQTKVIFDRIEDVLSDHGKKE